MFTHPLRDMQGDWTYIVRICVTATESYCIHVNVPIICSPNNIVLRTFVLKKRNKNSTLAYTIDTNIFILLYIYIFHHILVFSFLG